MSPVYGIDTSILVRLATGHPVDAWERSIAELEKLVLEGGCDILASNQVVGETYIALQHHYGISKVMAKRALMDVFQSGLVTPLNGKSVLAALQSNEGCGLVDRLIVDSYIHKGMTTLTLDRKMSHLTKVILM